MTLQRPNGASSNRAVFFALGLGSFAIGTAEFAAMTLVPMIAHALSITVPEAGHAIVAYAVGVCVGAPAIALVSSRVSRKTMLIGMMLLYAVGNGLTAIVPGYYALLICRFVSGLPHGAYFGIAGLVASFRVPPNQRSQAVAKVVLGLTIATIAGVPLASVIGQYLSWRWAFVLIATVALCTVLLVMVFLPKDAVRSEANILDEINALRHRQVWLTLGIGAVGFGSVFCVYTYLASIMREVTHAPVPATPVMFAIFGAGLTVGTLVCGWLADRKMMPTIGGVLLVEATAMAGFSGASHHLYELGFIVFMMGCGGGLATVVQARLLEVAVGAEGLAAALNQSAFNIANALGPYLGGLAIAAGLGWTSVGWVGFALAIGGFLIWLVSVAEEAKSRRVTPGGR
ncbi:MFS transporter [Brytella acorum]|uniref:MFS transporter n=1 Tax=Brytella acorum TaxID=2959299 RepID=A0AA35V6P5_9PROT|nr:MFS transporter [Brytella acorum]MDF3623813.1 MFS transporter [Brytella acorum]CAI9120727.1 MFS transporter [Brytella acorum]